RQDLIRRGGGRAVFTDHDAGRDVGEACRLDDRGPARQRDRHRGHRRVTGAGHVVHLSGDRADVQRLTVGRHDGHAFLAARGHDDAADAAREDVAGRSHNLRIRRTLVAAGTLQLVFIGGEDGGAAILRERAALWIDQHALARGRGGGDGARGDGVAEGALAVIGGEDDGGGGGRP